MQPATSEAAISRGRTIPYNGLPLSAGEKGDRGTMMGGPRLNREKKERKHASPLHFLRVMRYARAYLKYLIPGLICTVIVALVISVNILAILPTVQLIADKQGIPAWVCQYVTEKRLGLALADAEAEQPAHVMKVTGDADQTLRALRPGDTITHLDGEEVDSQALVRKLAWAKEGEPVRLTALCGKDHRPCEVVTTPRRVTLSESWGLRAAQRLPQGTTKEARMATLRMILAAVFCIGITGAVCRFAGEYLIALSAGRTILAIRRRMYRRALSLPLSGFESRGFNDLSSRFVQDSQEVYRGLNFVFGKTLREPLKAIFALMAALLIDWRVTVVVCIGAPMAAILIRRFGKIIRRANKRLLEGFGRMLAALEGSLSGIRVVKGYTMEKYERRHLAAVDLQMFKQQMKIERTDAMSSPVFEVIGATVGVVAIMYFAHLMFDQTMSFARFATLAACMAAVFDPMRKLSSFYNRIEQANAAVDRVFEVIDLPDELSIYPPRIPLPPLKHSIEFRNIRFQYPTAETPALDGISLTIRRGERVAFVGPNGSGKTTLLAVLMRFYHAQEGAILFDGKDVREFSIVSLRKQMSLITQDTVIFADTLANNIAYGNEDYLKRLVLKRRHPERKYHIDDAMQAVVSAAKAAYADEFIQEKPGGYEGYVGEHGVTLSGGQKQRIAIARAILRNAPIFIFDEATSQIDAESEQKIHDAVERFLEGRTALIIAHRFSTIMQADRIVVMDRGRIVDSGRHHDLMGRCKLYQTLYSTQILDDTEGG
ncbi:MAG TPA: ATP-binding cassette domain-containing protein, partial [Phycisphaerae bacterium]|nr:ATP-binding cassette domain-containing protein [Phycisphaerae bacterium]